MVSLPIFRKADTVQCPHALQQHHANISLRSAMAGRRHEKVEAESTQTCSQDPSVLKSLSQQLSHGSARESSGRVDTDFQQLSHGSAGRRRALITQRASGRGLNRGLTRLDQRTRARAWPIHVPSARHACTRTGRVAPSAQEVEVHVHRRAAHKARVARRRRKRGPNVPPRSGQKRSRKPRDSGRRDCSRWSRGGQEVGGEDVGRNGGDGGSGGPRGGGEVGRPAGCDTPRPRSREELTALTVALRSAAGTGKPEGNSAL